MVGGGRPKADHVGFLKSMRMRTKVYVDGMNLYYGALKRGGSAQYKWLNLVKLACEALQPRYDVVKVLYFRPAYPRFRIRTHQIDRKVVSTHSRRRQKERPRYTTKVFLPKQSGTLSLTFQW